ncbi:hypothetical protein DRE_02145 [Drechslerella stenobrocha 248]|uniref:Trafficking protein particle complex II-specific subunit 65 IgD3 domain-containing protein n=1 Tax=Drechslerella stenobrocha 248 TaxID=1043628 RepID=W7HW29_9PEZI|nr:hypothetical protein DRE_02145 [Drechslerella stenobrocha 248]
MASPGSIGPSRRGHRRTISTDIVEKARLEVFIAEDSNLDIEAFLRDKESPKHLKVQGPGELVHPVPALATLGQRHHLFFDEDLPVFIALQIFGIQDDSVYESYSSRLAVSLEVTAVENQGPRRPDGSRAPDGPILLYQKTIQDKDGGRTLWRDGDTRLAIWRIMVPLGHPKAKPINPRVVFSASATLKLLNQNTRLPENEYLSSRQALNVNILESFGGETPEKLPYLSALRVSRVIPTQSAPKESFSPLGYSSKRTFPIVPGLNFKLRGNKTPRKANTEDLFAHLTLEVTPQLGCNFEIRDVVLECGGVTISSIEVSENTFPAVLQVMDEITYLFKLPNKANPSQPPNLLKHIVVKLKGQAMVSDLCKPLISTHWETSIDFSPRSETSAVTVQTATFVNPPSLRLSTRPLSSGSNLETTSFAEPMGLTITFTSMTQNVHPGDIFSWRVFVMNRSNRARRLALLVPPKRRKGEGKILPSVPHNMTEPVVEDAALYSSYKSQHLEVVELIPLVNDVRIGPLAPNACHTAELRFIALATGVLTIEGVRVVDLMTNDITECRELPTVKAMRYQDSLNRVAQLEASASERAQQAANGITELELELELESVGGGAYHSLTPSRSPSSLFLSFTMATASLWIRAKRTMRHLQSVYLWDRIPVIPLIVLLLEFIVMARFIAVFNESFEKRPIITMMASNAVLNSIADTVAQTITIIRERAMRKPLGPELPQDRIAIEIGQLDYKVPDSLHKGELIPRSAFLPPPFEFDRLARFAFWGFLMAPLQFTWFKFLGKTFPISPHSAAIGPALKRVACDQLIFAPVGLAGFFTFMTIAEGGKREQIQNKFANVYMPALRSNYMLWPAVQIINFRLMPLQFQLPFASSVGILWTTYLSLTNSASEAQEEEYIP